MKLQFLMLSVSLSLSACMSPTASSIDMISIGSKDELASVLSNSQTEPVYPAQWFYLGSDSSFHYLESRVMGFSHTYDVTRYCINKNNLNIDREIPYDPSGGSKETIFHGINTFGIHNVPYSQLEEDRYGNMVEVDYLANGAVKKKEPRANQ